MSLRPTRRRGSQWAPRLSSSRWPWSVLVSAYFLFATAALGTAGMAVFASDGDEPEPRRRWS
ncbi:MULTISPECIES: hypothetical protein [unclassified Rhizobium]|uniref:hypothetical protein n=1 Tax=unclassified Rhizobium TaxID=2613769 RepID=UPI0011315A3F|nr:MULTISPECIES: hypothetical protein [unclassified Rhizobium]